MKILLIGGGGREHALAAKVRRDLPDGQLSIAPGNPGTAALGCNVPISAADLDALESYAAAESVDLTVVGPEAPLAAGIVDRFERRGLPIFGPTRAAARLESSKAFAKRLMSRCGVPTATFEVFTDAAAALSFVHECEPPIVVKASGLAGGKGAVVCATDADARRALRRMLQEDVFGEAGREVVVEEFLRGAELSVFFLSDGSRAVPLTSARDYKRRLEGDNGPNTGGMGAFAPVADATADLIEEVRVKIADPILQGLAAEGTPYRGFLYAGLMLTSSGPKVIEFNCRLGDPEAQVILPLMRESLTEPMLAVARGDGLGGWNGGAVGGRAALVTVLVSEGYPGSAVTGRPIDIPADLEGPDLHIYHAGTAMRDGQLITAGGRVIGVTGLGETGAEAAARSRAAAARITFEGRAWRRDIGHSEWG